MRKPTISHGRDTGGTLWGTSGCQQFPCIDVTQRAFQPLHALPVTQNLSVAHAHGTLSRSGISGVDLLKTAFILGSCTAHRNQSSMQQRVPTTQGQPSLATPICGDPCYGPAQAWWLLTALQEKREVRTVSTTKAAPPPCIGLPFLIDHLTVIGGDGGLPDLRTPLKQCRPAPRGCGSGSSCKERE